MVPTLDIPEEELVEVCVHKVAIGVRDAHRDGSGSARVEPIDYRIRVEGLAFNSTRSK